VGSAKANANLRGASFDTTSFLLLVVDLALQEGVESRSMDA